MLILRSNAQFLAWQFLVRRLCVEETFQGRKQACGGRIGRPNDGGTFRRPGLPDRQRFNSNSMQHLLNSNNNMKTFLRSIWAVLLVTLSDLGGTALAGPDLTSTAGATFDKTTVTAGQSFTLTMAVNNIGNAASVATKINIYLDTTYSYSAARKIGDITVPAIAAGGTASGLSLTYTVPIDKAAGTYLVYYWIDSSFAVTEDNENNNVLGYNLIVVAGNPPDLLASPSPTISDVSLSPGESTTVTLSVKNQGTGASVATKVNFYWHKDSSDFGTNSYIGSWRCRPWPRRDRVRADLYYTV